MYKMYYISDILLHLTPAEQRIIMLLHTTIIVVFCGLLPLHEYLEESTMVAILWRFNCHGEANGFPELNLWLKYWAAII